MLIGVQHGEQGQRRGGFRPVLALFPNALLARAKDGQVYLALSSYRYSDRAAAVVARDEPLWDAWRKEPFPSVGGASNVA